MTFPFLKCTKIKDFKWFVLFLLATKKRLPAKYIFNVGMRLLIYLLKVQSFFRQDLLKRFDDLKRYGKRKNHFARHQSL